MTSTVESAARPKLNRRQFLKATAALSAVSAIGLAGCDNTLKEVDEPDGDADAPATKGEAPKREVPTAEALEGGEWIDLQLHDGNLRLPLP